MTTIGFQSLAFAYQVADVFAFLVLAASGLAIIFGMMGVINMAHGEFITCGAYVTRRWPVPACRCRWRSWSERSRRVCSASARTYHRLPVLQSAD